MKNKFTFFLFFAFLLLTACGKEDVEVETTRELGTNEIYIYYTTPDRMDLYPVPFMVKGSDDLDTVIGKIMKKLQDTEDKDIYLSGFPEEITYKEFKHGARKGNIEIYFDLTYDTIDAEDLLFFKACVVQSLLNLEDVGSVTMFLTDVSNPDEETATVSEMFDYDSFDLTFGDENGYSQNGAITVYFANESGDTLKEYRKVLEITNNTSLPRLVVETLIEGPDGEGYTATIPEKTKIQNISIKDGICYVDLSDEFYDAGNPLKNDIIVYSVVNSLVELPNVSKVQFLKNGEKQTLFRGSMPFDGIFERNLDLIEQEVTSEEVSEEKEGDTDSEEELLEYK